MMLKGCKEFGYGFRVPVAIVGGDWVGLKGLRVVGMHVANLAGVLKKEWCWSGVLTAVYTGAAVWGVGYGPYGFGVVRCRAED